MSFQTNSMHLVYEPETQNNYSSNSREFDKENKDPDFNGASNLLSGTFTFTPRFLNKNSYWNFHQNDQESKTSLVEKLSKDLMARDSFKTLKRKALKRKVSVRSRQHLIPLSEQLQQERGEIEAAGFSATLIESNDTSHFLEPTCSASTSVTTESVRNIVREELKTQLLNLRLAEKIRNHSKAKKCIDSTQSSKPSSSSENHNVSSVLNESSNMNFEIETDLPPCDLECFDESEEKSVSITHGNENENISDYQDTPNAISEKGFMLDESGLTPSQKSFRTILQMQIEIWRKLLKLKESTEALERIALNRQLECEDNSFFGENELSSVVTADNVSPDSLFNTSLKAVFSQINPNDSTETPLSSLASNEFLPTFSCYAKMNEIEHRLSDVEFRMASIHQILQTVRQQQYRELKARQMSYSKSRKQRQRDSRRTSVLEAAGDGDGDGGPGKQIPTIKESKKETRSDPPLTHSGSTMSVRELNPYDESYYEWRQYHMNLLHYKKSERTMALNRRPTLHLMRPPIIKYFQSTENKYRVRVKKPFFIVTPSRTNSFWK
ncbi:unnamed protein product [Hermetia illucens]|uniref:Uncharacterized protein n=1 Tax=Hermetia illucens TaxID=343691 RepID=A0A7R8UPJ2_HERIL|nr:uncharacterized protein LOC119651776 isoform X2 [Hermetia illucens]CAD7084295.1 unnamed protein product [Hermetia illucens]